MAKKSNCKKVYTYFDPEKAIKHVIVAKSRKRALKHARLELAPGREIHKDEIVPIIMTETTTVLSFKAGEGFGPEAFNAIRLTEKTPWLQTLASATIS